MEALSKENLDVRLTYSRLSAIWDDAHKELDRRVRAVGSAKTELARAVELVEEQERNVSALSWALDVLRGSL